MNEHVRKIEKWVNDNPFMAGYTVGLSVGCVAMIVAVKGSQKILIYKLRLSQEKHGF